MKNFNIYNIKFILKIHRAKNDRANVFLEYKCKLNHAPKLNIVYECHMFKSEIERIKYDMNNELFICYLGEESDDDIHKLTLFYTELGWEFSKINVIEETIGEFVKNGV